VGAIKKGRNVAIIIGALAFMGVFLFMVPVIPFSYVEALNVTVPYDEQESYTVEFPYTVTFDRNEPLGQVSNFTLGGGKFAYWDPYIPSGRSMEFFISASDNVNLYIFNSSQYDNFMNASSTKPNKKELLNISRGKVEYNVSSSETYYFVIQNPHSDLSGIEENKVYIHQALIMANWQETETKYRTETRYRNITKYRTETQYRTITVKVNLWKLLTGSY
jgi:hypothetical protein